MHLTLRFFGDVSPSVADEIDEALARIEAPSFSLTVRGLAAFGTAQPSTLYAGIEASEGLAALQRAVDRAARQAGVKPEGKPFVPHVTLARMRGGQARQVAQFLGDGGHLRFPAFVVEQFVLMSSRPGMGGGPYGVEAVYPLFL